MAVAKVSLFVLIGSTMFILSAFDETKAKAGAQIYSATVSERLSQDKSNWFCADYIVDVSPELRRYGWAAFSHPDGSDPDCGECIEVTNAVTMVSALAMVVDKCDDDRSILQVDLSVFEKIDDVDGFGYTNGYLSVRSDSTDCPEY